MIFLIINALIINAIINALIINANQWMKINPLIFFPFALL